MQYEELSEEEKEIIRRYRQLPASQKKAVIASEKSFLQWLKNAVTWVWETIKMIKDISEIVAGLVGWLRNSSSDRL